MVSGFFFLFWMLLVSCVLNMQMTFQSHVLSNVSACIFNYIWEFLFLWCINLLQYTYSWHPIIDLNARNYIPENINEGRMKEQYPLYILPILYFRFILYISFLFASTLQIHLDTVNSARFSVAIDFYICIFFF